MNSQWRQLGLLLALNAEAATLIVIAYFVAKQLNAAELADFDWLPLTMLVALVCIVWTWSVALRRIFSGHAPKSNAD